MESKSEAVLFSVDSGVASIRFNRPNRLNAIGPEIARGFAEAVDAALAVQSVKVIVVSAEGRAFAAGGDLSYFHNATDRPEAARELINPIHAALKALTNASPIVVGSVQGAVAGAGMSLALGFDLLLAADDTTFNLAYARVAASPDCGGSWALPRLVGLRKALEIALLSDIINATEALRLGIANRVVPRVALEEETANLASRLASGPAIAYANMKSLMRTSFERDHGAQLDAEAKSFVECAATADFAEALDAFVEKRRPSFGVR